LGEGPVRRKGFKANMGWAVRHRRLAQQHGLKDMEIQKKTDKSLGKKKKTGTNEKRGRKKIVEKEKAKPTLPPRIG